MIGTWIDDSLTMAQQASWHEYDPITSPPSRPNLTKRSHDRRDNLPGNSLAPLCPRRHRPRTVHPPLSPPSPLHHTRTRLTAIHRGVILILGLGCLATYTGYVIGQFKLRYPHVHNMADAGEVMLGAIGREFFGAAQIIFLVFVMGSHILTFSIMLNTLTDHVTCTIAFGVVGMLVCLICTLPRTLLNVSYMAIASFISIIGAVMITMIGVGVQRPGDGRVDATVQTSLAKGFLAVTNIIFAYAGHVAFFSFISELKKPEEYPKALFLLQGVDTSMYLIVSVVVRGPFPPFPPKNHLPDRHTPTDTPAPLPTDLPLRRADRRVPGAGLHLGPGPQNRVRDQHPDDRRRGRHQRARRGQIHLRAALPRHGPHVQAQLVELRRLGAHRAHFVDTRLDYCRGHPQLQRFVGLDQCPLCELVYLRP